MKLNRGKESMELVVRELITSARVRATRKGER